MPQILGRKTADLQKLLGRKSMKGNANKKRQQMQNERFTRQVSQMLKLVIFYTRKRNFDSTKMLYNIQILKA